MRVLISLLIGLWSALTLRHVEAAPRVIVPPEQRLYSAVADEVYWQEIGRKVPTDKPVTSLAAWQGEVYAVLGGALHRLGENEPQAIKNAPAGLQRLFVLDEKVWGASDKALYVFKEGARSADKVLDGQIVDMCVHNGAVHAATRDDVYRYTNGAFVNIRPKSGWLTTDTTMIKEDGSQVLVDPVLLGPIERIASYNDTLYLLQPDGLALIDGETFVTEPVDWGQMPSREHRDMLALGSRLLVTTDRGSTLR